MKKLSQLSCVLITVGLAACAPAASSPQLKETSSVFVKGPVFTGFGPIAPMQEKWALPAETKLRVAFDVAKASDGESLNRAFETAARFVNMHVKAGVTLDNIDVAVVVHGGAVTDLLNTEAYAARMQNSLNPNISAIDALTSRGIRVILCGQTAAYRNVTEDMLLPNVEMSLSAMTAHAELQNAGYTLNPF